jgi:hypothetical protein
VMEFYFVTHDCPPPLYWPSIDWGRVDAAVASAETEFSVAPLAAALATEEFEEHEGIATVE